ncbi:MAG: hypothetical protein KatS3mg102_1424 [Planctomycetota bacterium]|nr:MAG: hypothetical protein KatS3mg102_1424 [Planctomycetota bacterium]
MPSCGRMLALALLAASLGGCCGAELIVDTRGEPARVYFRALRDAAGQPLGAEAPEILIGETDGSEAVAWCLPEELRGGRAALRLEFAEALPKDLQINLERDDDTVVRVQPQKRVR